MPTAPHSADTLITRTHPYDALPREVQRDLARKLLVMRYVAEATIYSPGEVLEGLYLIAAGEVHVTDAQGTHISILSPGNSFGERGLLRDGLALTGAKAQTDVTLFCLPADLFHSLREEHEVVARFFNRNRPATPRRRDVATLPVSELMSGTPIACPPDTDLRTAAQMMRDNGVSSLIVTDHGALQGIVTTKDMTNRAMAEGLASDTAIARIMTANPITLQASDLVSDVLHMMLERRISHLPILDAAGSPTGIITQTDLTRYQALSSGSLIHEIVRARSADEMATTVARIPQLLQQLVAASLDHHVATRLITDIADAATRRLLSLAEDTLGPPPVPYLWAACGSQGRQEQTGVSDQDNCLILDDAATPEHDTYFAALAKFVSDGLDRCGYFYCPGDMMATADRWRQPLRVWRKYFQGWIAKPDSEAQMLASVMFDLRPIGGAAALLENLVQDTLADAAHNSIFVAHMVSNALKHSPPLGLLRGFATVRSGEHKNTLDLKHAGVVPVVDLGRVYALQGQLTAVNTRGRLIAAEAAGVISHSGARDLIDAYDMIAETRLRHQAAQIKRGDAPNNFMPPSSLSDFERSHLRDAFVVIKTMQSALGHSRGAIS